MNSSPSYRVAAALVIFGLSVQAGCVAESESRGNSAEDTGPVDRNRISEVARIPDVSCDGLEQSILKVEATRTALGTRFGPPDSVRSMTEPNRHVPGQVDSLFGVYYPGLMTSIRAPAGGRDLISSVVVTDNRYLSEPRIGIGAAAADIIAALGEPTVTEAGKLVYDCGIGAEQPVTFELRNQTVHTISISYYVD